MKKYVSGEFVAKKYGIYKAAQDTITSFPSTIIANGQSASAVIKGNLLQSGTPTPASPIYPTETGDKTANLWYAPTTETSTQSGITIKTVAQSSEFLLSKGITSQETSKTINCNIPLPAGTYTVSVFGGLKNYNYGAMDRIALYDGTSYFQNNILVREPKTFTLSESKTITRILVVCKDISEYDDTPVQVCIVSGSTAPSEYIPYGYKIPISSGGTTTNVYLGEVQSERQIKKLVLDGTENWQMRTEGTAQIFYLNNSQIPNNRLICTHYVVRNWTDTQLYDNSINVSYTYAQQTINVHMDLYSLVNDFKAFLTAQYTAGTPVTIWYVLATPTTTTLNEPIRKIGDYADSVSVSNIPTTGTAEQFDVDTTLKPSEVDLTYTGWHFYNDKKRTSGEWV